ncbi:MAG: hypothetical protein GY861_01915 [bacterium]|nr:hypothetical protein [bacterium]
MKGFKGFLLLFMLLIAASCASAALELTSVNKDRLNLGDSIGAMYKIQPDENLTAFFKLSIKCGDYDLNYYTTPVNIDAGAEYVVSVPRLTLARNMVGDCVLYSELQAMDTSIIDTHKSETIIVSRKINTEASADKEIYKPGEEMVITGRITPTYDEISAEAKIFFNGKILDKFSINKNEFEFKTKLPTTIEAGSTNLSLDIRDDFDNIGRAKIPLKLEMIPTKLTNSISKTEVLPGEEVTIYVVLFDQSENPMEEKVSVSIKDPEGKKLKSLDTYTEEQIIFTFEESFSPGDYTVESKALSFKTTDTITLQEVVQISAKIEEGVVIIKNTGNVDYTKQLEIKAISEEITETILRPDILKINDEIEVDLNQELPGGIYEIEVQGDLIAGGVTIVDERTLSKKAKEFMDGPNFNILLYVIAAVIAIFVIRTILKRRKKRPAKKEKREDISKEEVAALLEKEKKEDDKPDHSIREKPEVKDFVEKSLKKDDEENKEPEKKKEDKSP